MKSLIATFGTLVFSLTLILAAPNLAIKPGVLSDEHQRQNKDCTACHKLLRGATAEKCTVCHKPADTGRLTTAGVSLLNLGKEKALFHQSLANLDCTGCHTIHTSARAKKATGKFKHDFLMEAAKNDCAACHRNETPVDSLHQQAGNQCAACHRTADWRAAIFDHKQFSGGLTSCSSCHQRKKPADSLHSQTGADCVKCHSTASWRPATYDHNAYFLFDRNHPSKCDTCHVQAATFEKYTCYGCHEHAQARIAAKHTEEGIRNVEDCARCHRGGHADDAEREREGEGRLKSDVQ